MATCTTSQAFCALGAQLVSQNNISVELDNHNIGIVITNTFWNNIKTILQNIYDYGLYGTRNPTEDEINSFISSVQNTTTITMTIYNTLLNILSMTNISNYPIITSNLFNSLQSNINNYTLNEDRCNNCNTGCNVNCQIAAQCCQSYNCYECYSCGSCDACDLAVNCCVAADSCTIGALG